ncbi:MAG: lipopolysaccharide biosynthesis protein [Eubacterium sp.]|nr:lipopolysaccharide biosynthesis protein [Eubacterium sp.]
MLERILFGTEKEQSRIMARTYFWNSGASFVYSLQSAILLMIVTRVLGLDTAGRFSIYYVTTQMLASIGSFSMRNFQVSDVRSEYSFRTYFSSRVITCTVMVLICLVYALVEQRTPEGLVVVMCLSLYRMTDGMEDVFHAEVQKAGRLDAGSIARLGRYICAVIGFTAACLITKNMAVASAVLFLCSLGVMLPTLGVIRKRYPILRLSFSIGHVWKLLAVCTPVMVSALLYNYLVNAPKYSIERVLTSEVQAMFNILFMPVFLINVLSQFIFDPMIAKMSIWWEKGEDKKLLSAILKQSALILGLTILVALAGYVLGYWLLGLFYGVDLHPWRGLLFILLLLGGIAALAAFFMAILTIMRRQVLIVIAYAISAVVGWRLLDPLVARYEMYGAGFAYGILMGIVLLILIVTAAVEFRKRRTRV